MFTGRRDGGRLNADAVDLPSPSISVDESLAYFKSKGLDVLDMTALLGISSSSLFSFPLDTNIFDHFFKGNVLAMLLLQLLLFVYVCVYIYI